MATLPPPVQAEPPSAEVCLSCQKPADWQSPTGHWFCQDCRDLYTRAFPSNGGTLSDLLRKEIEPIRWTVEGMIPEGLTMLAGKPKLGKSWLGLVLALAVAAGQRFLTYPTESGSVLYVALEDSERRMQDRALFLGAQQLGKCLDRFHYRTEWPTLDRGGLKQLEEWMADYPDTKLVVIDTFGKIRGELPGRDRYNEEYGVLGQLQTFALNHGIAILLIHHLRKMGADDWTEQLSGSQAVSGAADTILGLYRDRGQMDATLRTVSRDVEELELALKFNSGRWEYMGPADEYRQTVERTEILQALRDLGGKAKVAEVAALLDKSPAAASKLLVKLATEGVIRKNGYGVYSVGEVVEVGETEPPKTLPLQPNQPLQPPHIKGRIFQVSEGFTESDHFDDDYEPDPDDLAEPFEGD